MWQVSSTIDFSKDYFRQQYPILGSTNKGDTLAQAKQIVGGYQVLELDALIVIGGDGSLAILRELASQGNWNLGSISQDDR